MTQGKMQVAEGPIETRIFQLLSAKHAIGLEAKGMRHSRLYRQGGVKGLWAKHYGLERKATAKQVIDRIEEEIQLLKQRQAQQQLPLGERDDLQSRE
jgi:hypothetical protein